MADYETEMTVRYPQRNTLDSDKVSYYFESEKTKRDAWFCIQSEEDYSYEEDRLWK